MRHWKLITFILLFTFGLSATVTAKRPRRKAPTKPLWKARSQKLSTKDYNRLREYLVTIGTCKYKRTVVYMDGNFMLAKGFTGKIVVSQVIANCKPSPMPMTEVKRGRADLPGRILPSDYSSFGLPPIKRYPSIVMKTKVPNLPCKMSVGGKLFYFEIAATSFDYYTIKANTYLPQLLAKGFCKPLTSYRLPPANGYIYFTSPRPPDPLKKSQNIIYVRTKAAAK